MNCKRLLSTLIITLVVPPTATNATESATNIAAVSATFHATTLHPKLAHSLLSQSARTPLTTIVGSTPATASCGAPKSSLAPTAMATAADAVASGRLTPANDSRGLRRLDERVRSLNFPSCSNFPSSNAAPPAASTPLG